MRIKIRQGWLLNCCLAIVLSLPVSLQAEVFTVAVYGDFTMPPGRLTREERRVSGKDNPEKSSLQFLPWSRKDACAKRMLLISGQLDYIALPDSEADFWINEGFAHLTKLGVVAEDSQIEGVTDSGLALVGVKRHQISATVREKLRTLLSSKVSLIAE